MPITNIQNKFGPEIEEYIGNSKTSFFIFSPFISNNTLLKLVGNRKNITIVTSWKPEYLLQGVSSLELYPLCKKYGWKLFINSKLHAKIYSCELLHGYIGSANCTDRALYSKDGNYECMIFVDLFSSKSIIELNKIIYDSYLVTDKLYEAFVEWFSQQKQINVKFTEPNIFSDKAKVFSIYELPALYDPLDMKKYQKSIATQSVISQLAEHDIAIYGPTKYNVSDNEYLNRVADQFFEHPFIKEIDKHITKEGIYFGEFKKLIQKICTDVPVPYRYELTELVQNLIRWFTVLAPYEYGLRCEHISQCLYRIT